MLGKATVLVLGGGGAKGFAHLGALRALAEHDGPPIDSDRRILIDAFVRSTPYSLTLPIHSLFRYNQHLRTIERLLKPHEVVTPGFPSGQVRWISPPITWSSGTSTASSRP